MSLLRGNNHFRPVHNNFLSCKVVALSQQIRQKSQLFGRADLIHAVLQRKGRCAIAVLPCQNGEKVVLNQNDAMLLVPGTVRKRFPSEELAHYVIFNYTAAKGNDIPSNLFFKNAVNQTIRKLLDVYPYTYYRAADHLTSPSRGNSKINTVLPNLFNCVLTELFDSMNYSTKNIHVLNAIKYINDNITRSLSLSDVSEFLHITKEYTAKLFKRELGMTASEFINKQKVTLAKDMLTNDAMSLAEIASCLGYENYGYFSNVFKDFFGIFM